MAKKKKMPAGLENLARILENADVAGVAVILLGKDGTITIGSDGLDADTTEDLLRQGASLLSNAEDANQTIH